MSKQTRPKRGRSLASELIGDLQQLGFSEYEARTYMSLLASGTSTAYEVSKNAGLPRANTYGALESLAKKGAVQPISQKPVRYAPVEPETLLSQVVQDMTTLCSRLKSNLREVAVQTDSNVVWSLEGEEILSDKIDELIGGAKSHIWIKASTEVLHKHAPALKQAAARGVTLLLIVFGVDTKDFKFGKTTRVYLHEASGVRIGGADNLFTITIDYQVALTARLADQMMGAYTTNEPIVRMAETLIRHDFYMAEILTEFGPDIERRFGKYLVNLRQQTFSPQQIQELEVNLEKLLPAKATSKPMPR